MAFLAKYIDEKFMVYKDDSVFGWISFDHKLVSATIFVDGKEYRAEPESATEKDIVMRQDGLTLFKFKFDYLWGGAELHINGKDTGYEITGKWFKKGTRFVDANANDLVLAVSDESRIPQTKITIVDESEATPLMIMATLYYHIYTYASKRFSVFMGSLT